MWDVTRIFVQEKIRYSTPVLEWRKRREWDRRKDDRF